MIFKVLDENEKRRYSEDIISMLTYSDNEFVPPLSARSSTLQSNLSDSGNNRGNILSYYREMNSQNILAAIEDYEILGFVSYREDYKNEVISEKDLPNIYVSTLVTRPEARGKGLTKKMYAHLFDVLYPAAAVFTRTWSTNAAHTKILSSFGFQELDRKKNDRGEGIDTVYYVRNAKTLVLTV